MQLRQIIFVCCILIASCGGGGGVVGIDGSGSKVSVSETGAINGFGSVIVNGVHYNTDNAEVYIRGELAQESDLKVGDFIVVVGHTNESGESIAEKVYYQPLVTGNIESIDKEQNTISVLGQTVILLNDTTFSEDIIPRNIEGLKLGQKVTVSGVSDDNQNIRATRVELTTSTRLDLFGRVDAFNAYNQTYNINGLTVDLSDIPGHTQNKLGDWVAVSGENFSNGILHADHLNTAMDYRQLQTVNTIKINGFVRELKNNGNFYVDRVPVILNQNTEFEGGEASDIAQNSSLQVEGSLNAYHFLVAKKVSFKPTPDTQVYGRINNIQNAKLGEFHLGFIEVQGSNFKIDVMTRLVGDRERRISFYDLRIGDTVMISGFYKNDKYIASAVTVDNRVFEKYIIEMQGWVASATKELNTFSLFNTIIRTDNKTVYSDSGFPITQERCFELLASGRHVQVRGYYEGYLLIATSIQINPWGYIPPPPKSPW